MHSPARGRSGERGPEPAGGPGATVGVGSRSGSPTAPRRDRRPARHPPGVARRPVATARRWSDRKNPRRGCPRRSRRRRSPPGPISPRTCAAMRATTSRAIRATRSSTASAARRSQRCARSNGPRARSRPTAELRSWRSTPRTPAASPRTARTCTRAPFRIYGRYRRLPTRRRRSRRGAGRAGSGRPSTPRRSSEAIWACAGSTSVRCSGST